MAWAATGWLRPLVAGLAVLSIGASWLLGRDRAEPGAAAQAGAFAYPASGPAAGCGPDDPARRAAPLRTPGGVTFAVRTPSNYDPSYAHALLVVFAAAGADRDATERFTGLTPMATAAGFVVAYADHPRLSLRAIRDLGTIPELVAEAWCIDPHRVFLTGHSDGGTVATALALTAEPRGRYAGIAPSAAGFAAADLSAYQCPAPLAVYVSHGAADALFPGFGREAAAWWAACNQCATAAPERRGDACVEYRGCAAGARTVYCEHAGRHTVWPPQNQGMIAFFTADAAAGTGAPRRGE